MKREPLSKADFALLRLDSPTNRMVVTALITLETRLELDQLKMVLEHSMIRIPRFCQRVVLSRTPLGKAYWETVEPFDLDRHIHSIHTPLPDEPELLKEIVSRLMSVGLDFSRPLWQIYLVEHYGSGSALVLRFHHCIADGISMIRVLFSMSQSEPCEILVEPDELPVPPSDTKNLHGGDQVSQKLSILRKLSMTGRNILSIPVQFDDLLHISASTASALGQLLFSPSDWNNLFRGQVDIPKRAAWSPGLSLDEVKFIGRSFDCTVNDILLSAIAGALYRYMIASAANSVPVNVHSFVPVDLRRGARLAGGNRLLGDAFDQPMGNRFGFAVLELPVGTVDPLERLQMIHQKMDILKASGEALVSYGVLSLMGSVPGNIQNLAARFWLTKGSAVMTNVAGPPQQLYLGTAAIGMLMAWVPQTGPVGLGVSMISYNGKIYLGVATDQGLVPDPDHIIEYFSEELLILGAKARLNHLPLEQALHLPPAQIPPPGAQTLDQTILG